MMSDMLARLDAQLDRLGMTVVLRQIEPLGHAIDRATATLARGSSTQTYTLFHGRTVPLATAGEPDNPTLVFTTFVSPRSADTFRRAGVQYLDTAGNAWVHFGDVLIDVRGRPRPERTTGRPRLSGNLFSTGRAQVIFALLTWPHLWDATQRDLARAAGVSLGQAHNTLALLADAGYASAQRDAARTDLLELWAAAFPTGLAQRLTLATYRGDIATVRGAEPLDQVFVSGASAATDLLRPAALTLYVDDLDPRLPVVNRWRTDGEPNIVVRRKFWNAPGDGSARLDGPQNAPWPLVYADLLASDDPRVRSTAKEWKDRHAGSARHA